MCGRAKDERRREESVYGWDNALGHLATARGSATQTGGEIWRQDQPVGGAFWQRTRGLCRRGEARCWNEKGRNGGAGEERSGKGGRTSQSEDEEERRERETDLVLDVSGSSLNVFGHHSHHPLLPLLPLLRPLRRLLGRLLHRPLGSLRLPLLHLGLLRRNRPPWRPRALLHVPKTLVQDQGSDPGPETKGRLRDPLNQRERRERWTPRQTLSIAAEGTVDATALSRFVSVRG